MNETAGDAKKLPFPKHVALIILFLFCERTSFNGMRSVLSLYLSHRLGYTDDYATFIFHSFIMVSYFLPIFGAIISDSWLGKFNTIFYLSLVYLSGSIMLTLSSFPMLQASVEAFTLGGLTLITLGASGIKPCIVAFGADQFKVPEQKEALSFYFNILYFLINAGTLVSQFTTPIFREDVRCYGEKECFPLAFGVPSLIMIAAVVLMAVGRPWYKVIPPEGNMIVLVSATIGTAVATKWKSKEKRDHWLDYAEPKYDKDLIADVKVFIRVLVLFTPIPFFWALFDQQGSRWTFQATRMAGDLGGYWDIKPDQMQVLNALLVLILIPLYKVAFYPALEFVYIRRPLQKMTMGGFLAGVSFFMAAILEFCLESTYPELPQPNNAQLRIFNGESCDYTITTNIEGQDSFILKSLDAYTYKDINVPDGTFELKYDISSADPSCPTFTPTHLQMKQKTAHSIFLNSKDTANPIHVYEDNPDKPKRGLPYGRTLPNVAETSTISWLDVKHGNIELEEPAHAHELGEFGTGLYQVRVDGKMVLELTMYTGGSYVVIINEKSTGSYDSRILEVTSPNSVHMLWQLPQYIVITMAEVMFNITALEFTYRQSPISMKAMLMAVRYLTNAFGNLIVAVTAKGKFLDSQANEFLLFGFGMCIDMLIFMWVAYRYIPNQKMVDTSK